MKKSTIWLLTIVMAITFGTLLYFQLMYLEKIVQMRNEQFNENVKRSLYGAANFMEKEETLHYLSEDMDFLGTASSGFQPLISLSPKPTASISPYSATTPDARYRNLHEAFRGRYLYQRGLLDEVILMIMRDAGSRPIMERADSTLTREILRQELANNGIDLPFVYAVTYTDGRLVYSSPGFEQLSHSEVYSQIIFPGSEPHYYLKAGFPTKSDYIFSSVKFVIPTLIFTLILLIVFVYTILLAFRQKKLTEMKSDFVNNMTHELKTPISTISLAAQMLNDPSVNKTPSTLEHLSSIVVDESKRLRFQVDKVLQLSVFSDSDSNAALKFKDVDVNRIISSVVSTFKIKVEKFNGRISLHLDASDDVAMLDEMQFTNVIFNLLDNALKYRREDVEPQIEISTKDVAGNKIEIRVKDNGIGIARDDLKHIFERFYRVSTGNHHDIKGFGIGLAYVKKMVQLFKGQIFVESEINKGSTFIILLPLIVK